MANKKKDSVSGIRLSSYEEGIESMCKILEEERREGRIEGQKEGRERINELNRRLLEGRLLKDGREVDILKSLKEPGYQERLLMEYNL